MVYSRYGSRQWAAPFPRTRLIVKDPFAMLSMPAIHEVTRAESVLLFRHPGASLTSYRRMGWVPDNDELAPIIAEFTARNGSCVGVEPPPAAGATDVESMAWFWNALYGIALHDAERLGNNVLVLAHEEIAAGGHSFGSQLFARLDLPWNDQISRQFVRESQPDAPIDATALHNFDRNPAQVAHEWESRVEPADRDYLERATDEVHTLLRTRAFRIAE